MEQILSSENITDKLFSFLNLQQTLRLRLVCSSYVFHNCILWHIFHKANETRRGLLLPQEWNTITRYPKSVVYPFLRNMFVDALYRNNLLQEPQFKKDKKSLQHIWKGKYSISKKRFYREYVNDDSKFDKDVNCLECGVSVSQDISLFNKDHSTQSLLNKYDFPPPIRASLYGGSSFNNGSWSIFISLKDKNGNVLRQESNFNQQPESDTLKYKEVHVIDDYPVDEVHNIVLKVSGNGWFALPIVQIMTPVVPTHDIASRAFEGKEINIFDLPVDALDHVLGYLTLKDILCLRRVNSELFSDVFYRHLFKKCVVLCTNTEYHTVCDWHRFFDFVYRTRKNLVVNPDGAQGFRGWENDGQWGVQSWGGRRIDAADGKGGNCFVGSYIESSIHQVIDLQHVGGDVWNRFRENLSASSVHFDAWAGGRRDCGSTLTIHVQLLDTRGELISEYRKKAAEMERRNFASQRFHHMFNEFGSQIPRQVKVLFSGKDKNMWAGYYGPRVAGVSVRLFLPFY